MKSLFYVVPILAVGIGCGPATESDFGGKSSAGSVGASSVTSSSGSTTQGPKGSGGPTTGTVHLSTTASAARSTGTNGVHLGTSATTAGAGNNNGGNGNNGGTGRGNAGANNGGITGSCDCTALGCSQLGQGCDVATCSCVSNTNAGGNTGNAGSTGSTGSTGCDCVSLDCQSLGEVCDSATCACVVTTGGTGNSGNTAAAATTTGTTGSTGGSCPGYAEPNTPASCTCGKAGSCTANNCYGGWYCELSDDKCVAPPTNCGGAASTTTGGFNSSGAAATTTTGAGTTTSGAATTTTGSTGGSCAGYAEPSTPASCHCGKSGSCAANNCYGGWYCELSDDKCVAPPSNCSGGAATTTTGGGTTTSGPTTSGPTTTTTGRATTSSSSSTTGTSGSTGTVGGTGTTAFTSNITVSGGTESNLYFAALGDCRPENMDDTANYPTATITQIYKDIQELNPRPPFTISTGDYMYCSSSDCQTQINYYESARTGYSGIEFAGMGNHECTGYTDSNCGASGADGITPNYTAFMNTLMKPLGQSNPYYAIDISDPNGKWTAKFVMLAANAWDTAQSSWLDSVMAKSTTYTFVERHEPTGLSGGPPGLTASESILASYHITLKLVGHTHEYQQVSGANPPEVIIGNGGVPGTTGPFGYALVEAQSNGDVKVTEMDASSNAALGSFTVAP